ncbi:MAG: hypothetical protein OXG52_06585 [bacterium]|nr:hypothetical protein [bacterium]
MSYTPNNLHPAGQRLSGGLGRLRRSEARQFSAGSDGGECMRDPPLSPQHCLGLVGRILGADRRRTNRRAFASAVVVSQFVASMLAGTLDEQHAFSGIGEHPSDDASDNARPCADAKVLVFTQYIDTQDYLADQLRTLTVNGRSIGVH